MTPTPLVGRAMGALLPENSVSVDISRCVRHRCSTNVCTLCIDTCPAKALSWEEAGLHVDPNACTQCLECLAVCPTAALTSPELSLPRLLSDLAEHPLPVLGCNGQPDTEAHARMPCLGCLGHPEVMVLVALVFQDRLHINLTACHDCPNGSILSGVEAAFELLQSLVPGHGVKLIRNKDELEFVASSLSRRKLFSMLKEQSIRAAAKMARHLQQTGDTRYYGSKEVPAIRLLLLKALKASPEALRQKIKNRLFGKIAFTPQCNRSERCVGVCPTGAIQTPDDESPLLFDQNLCVSCNSCQSFCPTQGVLVSSKRMKGLRTGSQ